MGDGVRARVAELGLEGEGLTGDERVRGIVELGVEGDTEGKCEGVVELGALDAELVKQALLLFGGDVVDGADRLDQKIQCGGGFRQRFRASFWMSWIEIVLGGLNALRDGS